MRYVPRFALLLGCGCLFAPAGVFAADFSGATVVIRGGDLPPSEKIAPTILTGEIAGRTGLKWAVSDQWPAQARAVIALSVKAAPPAWKDKLPATALDSPSLGKPEGFSIRVNDKSGDKPPAIFVTGADPRGLMFGVGKLLRSLEWSRGSVKLAAGFAADEAPDVPLRGHQLGFRARANSWDAWTVAQFDQYIRDLVIFGANSIENIPFEDTDRSVLMKVSRDEMNIAMSDICARYGIEYWVWVPVLIRLPNPNREAGFLKQQEAFYSKCKRLDAVFVPGGDPGSNPALELMTHLQDMGALLTKYHPQARVWVSLQYFKPVDIDNFYKFLDEKNPPWFGGVVMGPSSPPLEPTRARLPKKYPLRWYPDITHIVRCQYEVPWLDPAYGVTLGREPVNPRPIDYTAIYRQGCRYTNGFLTYSDGIHDDFNKNLWTALGWNPERDPREVAIEYSRLFGRPDLAEAMADGLFALETNWRGSIADNSSVDGTLLLWQRLEKELGTGRGNWRFEMHLMRAYYDAYTRHRQLYETELQRQAIEQLADAARIGADAAVNQARDTLNRATTQVTRKALYDRNVALAESLFQSIGYQTSMEKYHASGSERGCVMDFINYPLNDRWWLEGQFDRIEKLGDNTEKLARVAELVKFEKLPAGSFYDDVGNVARNPRAPKLVFAGDAALAGSLLPDPTQRWMGEQRRNIRFAWHTYLNRPAPMIYSGVDPQGRYTVRLFAQGDSPLLIDGKRASRLRQGDVVEEVREQEFEVPAEAVADGRLELTWEQLDEAHLNWRQRHYVTEVWLLKTPAETGR